MLSHGSLVATQVIDVFNPVVERGFNESFGRVTFDTEWFVELVGLRFRPPSQAEHRTSLATPRSMVNRLAAELAPPIRPRSHSLESPIPAGGGSLPVRRRVVVEALRLLQEREELFASHRGELRAQSQRAPRNREAIADVRRRIDERLRSRE